LYNTNKIGKKGEKPRYVILRNAFELTFDEGLEVGCRSKVQVKNMKKMKNFEQKKHKKFFKKCKNEGI